MPQIQILATSVTSPDSVPDMAVAEPKNSPRKANRSFPPSYTSCLLYDEAALSKLREVKVASCNPGQDEAARPLQEDNDNIPELLPLDPEKLVVPDSKSCSCCQISFDNREDQLSHFKNDWHRHNLHRRLKGQTPINEDKFEEVAGDVSSISGSDDDEQEERDNMSKKDQSNDEFESSGQKRLHKVYFTNGEGELISVYRCVLHHKKDPVEESSKLVSRVSQLPKQPKWIVVMTSSGHFAGAVFEGKQVVEHKTFHRYTVRAKRGTAQSTMDNKGKNVKSVGANMRRHHEQALVQEVQELMTSWSHHFETSDFIFVRIPVPNRNMFYGGKTPVMKKEDQRIRVIPFATRRPTLGEVKRVHQMLASIECYGKNVDLGSVIPLSPARFYSKDTDQLEVREPRVKGVKLPKVKADGRGSSPAKALDSKDPDSSEEYSSIWDLDPRHAPQLVENVQTVDMTHLKEFDNTPVRKNNNKKKTKEKTSAKHDPERDENRIRWRNKLFTCCKTGDVASLLSTFAAIQESDGSTVATPTPSTSTDTAEVKENVTTSIGDMDQIDDAVVKKSNVQSEAPSPPSLLVTVLNAPVGDSKVTFLHLAGGEGHGEVINELLTNGADPTVKDGSGKLPFVAANTEGRNAFRRFMAAFPDKFDYTKAQVPGPLTAEMEKERQMKLAEKRKQKKKAANERNKDKKATEVALRIETQEKDRYLALSDREKRALAADRRILQMQSEQGGAKPVLSRCYQCGADMTGKVPFEYADFKFCATKCLREHRSKPKS